jgi:hypothetical protein
MKLYIVLWLLVSPCFCSAQDALIASLRRLAAMQDLKEQPDNAEYLQASSQTLQLWNTETPENRTSLAHKMALIHFERAKRLAAANDFKAAALELTAEAAMQKEFDGRLEFATKSPDIFFRDLAELQAQVTSETGSDPLAGRVGYSFEKDGEGFTAARLELGDDIAGITVPEIGADEALALVHRLNRQGGKFVAAAPRWLVVPKGPLPDVLNQATREVAFDSSGKMTVHRLQKQGESSPKANPSAANNTQAPSIVQPTAPKKAPSTAPAPPTPSEEAYSSTPWSIIVVLIVAAIGLLWLLLRGRK